MPARRSLFSALTYHSVGCNASPYSLPRELFSEQIAALSEQARVADFLEVANAGLAGTATSSKPQTAITFDDGYLDVLEVAAPILNAARMPFTVFVTTDLMSDRNAMSWSPHYRQVPPLCWHSLAELQRSGATIGAHTRTHPRLRTLTKERLREELCGAKQILEDKLGVKVAAFAYPFGQAHDYDARAVEILDEAGFAAACTTRQTTISPNDSRFEIPRLTVSESHTAEDVLDLISGRYNFMRWYGQINSTLVRLGLRPTVEQEGKAA